MTASFKPPIGTLGSGRYAPYAQRPDGRFVHHVGGHKRGFGFPFQPGLQVA